MAFLYQVLEQELREAIRQGVYLPGERLPSIRQLCEQRHVAKATVINAYSRLEASGDIESRGKAGYFACGRYPVSEMLVQGTASEAPEPVNMTAVMRDIMAQSAAFDIAPEKDDKRTNSPGLIQLNRSIGRALRANLQGAHHYYDEPAGLAVFRQQIAERYRRLGCHIQPQQIVVTAGCQHALSLALQSCCEEGDVVAVETPGFYGVLQLLESLGLKALEIPQHPRSGMDTDKLEALLNRWKVKACVVTPAFSTPMGAVMSAERREHLLHLAEQYDFQVIEDDIYGDLGFQNRPVPLKHKDTNGRVMLCGSFSKSLSRDLRMGWIITDHDPSALIRLKMVNLLASSRFVEQGLTDFLSSGAYESHLKKQRLSLQHQRDQLLGILSTDWQALGQFSVTVPDGGLCLWVELPDHYDVAGCYLSARAEGIIITPGNLFTAQDCYRNCLRLSFAHPWDDRRRQALGLLGNILLKSA